MHQHDLSSTYSRKRRGIEKRRNYHIEFEGHPPKGFTRNTSFIASSDTEAIAAVARQLQLPTPLTIQNFRSKNGKAIYRSAPQTKIFPNPQARD